MHNTSDLKQNLSGIQRVKGSAPSSIEFNGISTTCWPHWSRPDQRIFGVAGGDQINSDSETNYTVRRYWRLGWYSLVRFLPGFTRLLLQSMGLLRSTLLRVFECWIVASAKNVCFPQSNKYRRAYRFAWDLIRSPSFMIVR